MARLSCLSILFFGACLAGCAAHSNPPTGSAEAASAQFPAAIDDRLGRAAERTAAALETLALIERTRTPPATVRVNEALLTTEMRQPITIGWSGPATEAVRRIAETVGYRYVETGARPASPVLISLDARERSAGQVLADIGLRVQSTATVIVNQPARVVEYRHGASSGRIAANRQPASGQRAVARRVGPGNPPSAPPAPVECPPCERVSHPGGGAR